MDQSTFHIQQPLFYDLYLITRKNINYFVFILDLNETGQEETVFSRAELASFAYDSGQGVPLNPKTI